MTTKKIMMMDAGVFDNAVFVAWGSIATTHHFVMQVAARKVGWLHCYTWYSYTGDEDTPYTYSLLAGGIYQVNGIPHLGIS